MVRKEWLSQIVELAEISNSYSDFTETDIINRNSKIIDSFEFP